MPSSGLPLKMQGFFDVLLVPLGKTSDFAFKNYKMQAKIERNFKGFLRAFSRVYDGIILSLKSLKQGLIIPLKNELYF